MLRIRLRFSAWISCGRCRSSHMYSVVIDGFCDFCWNLIVFFLLAFSIWCGSIPFYYIVYRSQKNWRKIIFARRCLHVSNECTLRLDLFLFFHFKKTKTEKLLAETMKEIRHLGRGRLETDDCCEICIMFLSIRMTYDFCFTMRVCIGLVILKETGGVRMRRGEMDVWLASVEFILLHIDFRATTKNDIVT